MQNMTIIARFTYLTILVILTLVIGSAFLIYDNKELNRLNHQVAESHIAKLNLAHQLKLSIVQVQQWLTDISATRALDGLNDGFDEAAANAKTFHQLINKLQSVDPQNSDLYQDMIPVFKAYYQVGQKMAKEYVKNGPAGGNKLMAEFDKVAAKMSQTADGFLEKTQTEMDEILIIQDSKLKNSLYRTFIVFTVIALSMFLLYFIMIKALTFLSSISKALTKVADGDLTEEVPDWCGKNDELSNLCSGVISLRSTLTSLVSQIKNTVEHLLSTTQNMSQVSNQSMNLVDQQKLEIIEIASAMHEMSSSSQSVASSAESAVEFAHNAGKNATNGKDVVNQAVTIISDLSQNVTNAGDTIGKLDEYSTNIGGIIGVIRGIADQTNLLALNAAIEAARAGEQGRGFAVVADEVRTLASRTQESTEEINNMIEQLQGSAKQAVTIMEQGRNQTNNGVEQAKQAMESLETINESVQSITQMNQDMANASKEQGSTSENLSSRVNSISNGFEQTVDSAKQTAELSQNLDQLSEKLNSLISPFKLS
jgi:methyl-accepting chemotaxis protein